MAPADGSCLNDVKNNVCTDGFELGGCHWSDAKNGIVVGMCGCGLHFDAFLCEIVKAAGA